MSLYNNANAPLQIANGASEIMRKFDINGIFARHLNKLQGFKIVLICDDSTSMKETLLKGQTKWDELRTNVAIVIEVASAFNCACDVLFLNRMGLRNVKNVRELNEQFSRPPEGCTPLTKSFNIAIENNRAELRECKLLIIVFTDGCPTSDQLSDKEAITEFKNALKYRTPIERIFVTIVACTDDEYSLKYLNNWDNKIKYLDVVDDYESEKKEIYAAKRIDTAFTYGNYVAKILLGSFVKEIDQLDEKKSSCTLL